MNKNTEVWLAIPGWEGFYDASNIGRIRGRRRVIMRKNGIKKTVTERILAQRLNKVTGYFQIALKRPGIVQTFNTHKLIAAAFLGPVPPAHEVAHADGVKTRNIISNLSYKTRFGNMKDRERHGVVRRGETHGSAKLNDRLVLMIRASKLTQEVLASQCGVSQSLISMVQRKKIWSHI